MEIRLAPNGTHFILQMKDEMGIEVPISATGAKVIADILRARQFAPRPKIGTPAFPLQSVVDAWVVQDQRKKALEAKKALEDRLTAVGLDDLEIDL